MLRLAPMNEDDLAAYLERSIAEYAREKVQAGNWPSEVALERAEQEVRSLLPEGLETPGQHFITLVDDQLDTHVGVLWFGVRDDGAGPYAWVWDIRIDEDFRRRGYAMAAFRALEDRVRAMGLSAISLHVFGHNKAARALYDKLGFEVTNLNLSRHLQ